MGDYQPDFFEVNVPAESATGRFHNLDYVPVGLKKGIVARTGIIVNHPYITTS
jgi:hypothetical protein